jgi:copper(I)-binding protein
MKLAHRLAFALLVLAAALPAAAIADDVKSGVITIDHPWVRASIGKATNTAAYMKIENAGDSADRLLAVKTDAADNVMLHESRMEMGVMKMVHLPNGVEIPAHGSAELKPLGLHVMLMGLKAPLKDGETLPLTLVFERAGDIPVKARVGKAKPGMDDHK